MGYPTEVLSLPYDPQFILRGVIIDKRRGNLLKIDRHKYVRRAYHGLRELTDRRVYNRVAPLFTGSNFANIDTRFMVIGMFV